MVLMSPTMMQTFTGKAIDLANFREDDVRLADIAHALSLINRFTGHTTAPYSVAQHSVLVSKIVEQQHALWGLMHDASEAYLGDVSTPLKMMLPNYRELEDHVQRTIATKFGMRWPVPHEVKEADLRALLAEKRDIVPGGHEFGIALDPVAGEVVVLDWKDAKQQFIDRFKELVP
jgi:5'-deoxynucleotidase YfbR-like HD superfamily hydrolase